MRLNVEQRKIIELEPNGHMLVKGVAGSGKTTVAVHRASFLKEHYCPEKDDNLLIVTYNKTLLKYLKYQYEEVEEQEKKTLTSGAKIDINNIDSLMYRYFMAFHKRENVSIGRSYQFKNAMKKAITKVQQDFHDVNVMTPSHLNFLEDEIDWIKACDIPDLETYQEIDRIGRSEGGSGNPQKLLKNSRTRESIYTLMEVYDELLLKDKVVDFKTMNKLALEEAMTNPGTKYTHIMIDESQDLSKVQLKFIKQLLADKTYASVMFVADNTQSIYPQSWLGKGRSYATIGFDMSGKSRILSKNYRTTTEISKAAYSLIEHDEQINNNEDFVKPALIDRHGHKPIYNLFAQNSGQTKYIANEIKMLQDQYSLRDICIVARQKQTLDSMKIDLEEFGVSCELMDQKDMKFDTNKVKMTTMHSIKGLEFKVVFLINLDDQIIPDKRSVEDDELLSEERKLMYVGMTRSKELLYLSSVGNASMFINDIDKSLLSMRNGVRLRPYQTVPISNYKFADQLTELHGREEAVRQWFLKELEDMYSYPEELMEIEYTVHQFSTQGYVDIAITIEREGKTVPYIFVEVKAFGTGTDDALGQLKSYMKTSDDVRFGVVTDGISLKVIDAKGQEVSDIPAYQPQFSPNKQQEKTYIDFRNQITYAYSQNVDEPGNIEVKHLSTDSFMHIEESVAVPLIGEVVAGIPQIANEQFEEMILLPKEWVIQENETFALRVTGDSMTNADIDKGDLVIVHSQSTANVNDIVIAVIGNDATVKKYLPMGGEIILISENPAYEPIQMAAEDVQINGKVIGVLKG